MDKHSNTYKCTATAKNSKQGLATVLDTRLHDRKSRHRSNNAKQTLTAKPCSENYSENYPYVCTTACNRKTDRTGQTPAIYIYI